MRFEDWPRRLQESVAAAEEAPFAWGSHDCLSFAASVVMAITGEDPAAPVRGRYGSYREALRVTRDLGCSDFPAVFDHLLRYESIDPLKAQRGDVALVQIEANPSLVVVEGRTVCGPGAHGLSRQWLCDARRAWRIT